MKKPKILVVDSAPRWRRLSYDVLTRAGYEVSVQPGIKIDSKPSAEEVFDLALIDMFQAQQTALYKLAGIVKQGSDGKPNIIILIPIQLSIAKAREVYKLPARGFADTPFNERGLIELVRGFVG